MIIAYIYYTIFAIGLLCISYQLCKLIIETIILLTGRPETTRRIMNFSIIKWIFRIKD